MAGKYTEVQDPTLIRWSDPGVIVEGILRAGREVKTELGAGLVYEVELTAAGKYLTTDDKGKELIKSINAGELVAFFVPAQLERKLSSVTPGLECRIKYTGDKPSEKKGQNAMKLFTVEKAMT